MTETRVEVRPLWPEREPGWVEAGEEADDRYRYRLWRHWGAGGRRQDRLIFIMLNPSTASATTDDPTLRRCVGFARREGYHGVVLINLYAYRSSKPRHLVDEIMAGRDIYGPDNPAVWDRVLRRPRGKVVVAWGASGRTLGLPMAPVAHVFRQPYGEWWCLGETAGGQPRHPLYVRADQPLVPWVQR